jgi:Ca2+-binding EF-hand superfamily protein
MDENYLSDNNLKMNSSNLYPNLEINPNKNYEANIEQLANDLAKEMVDEKTIKKYGTYIDESLGKDYTKSLKKRYEELSKQFIQIDSNRNNEITKEEVYNFFKDQNNTIQFAQQFPNKEYKEIDMKYIDRLFHLFDKNKDEKITRDEFVFSYIKLEEKLNIKKKKLMLLHNDLKDSLIQYNERLKKSESQKLNVNGVCENASLSITLLKAKDLEAFIPGTSPSTFVVFTLDGKKQQSNLVTSNANPEYQEDFSFPITRKGETLTLEIFDQSTFSGTQLIGKLYIDLVLLEHQQKSENWYTLSPIQETPVPQTKETIGESPNGKNPSVLLRLRYIYDWQKYYTNLIKKTNEQIKRLREDIDELGKFQESFKKPFGIILAGDVNSIIDKRIFEKSEDILDYITSTRRSVYSKPSRFSEYRKNQPITMVLDHLSFDKNTRLISKLCIGLCLLTFISRANLFGLIVNMFAGFIVHKNNRNYTENYLVKVVYLIGGSILFDILWIIVNYGNWKENYNSGTLLFTFVICMIEFVVKIVFMLMMLQYKDKEEKRKKKQREQMLGRSSHF